MHLYMSKAQFPQNWATAELIKQYMQYHCCYEVKKGQMMPRHQRPAATSSGHISQLPNVDSEEEKDDEKNDGDENEGDDTNRSGEEDD